MGVFIEAIECHLPEKVLTNEALSAEFPDWSVDKIAEKTGIYRRHIAASEETSSDLGVAAAEKLFQSGKCRPEDIDLLLFCTQSPDYLLPTTACLIQNRLGLRQNCAAFDINLGCSGFVYGLSIVKSMMESNQFKKALFITAETYSKYLRPDDRSVRTLFGDGAAATLLTLDANRKESLGSFCFGTDGSGGPHLIVESGGHRYPNCVSGTETQNPHLVMNGKEIFTFTLEIVPPLVRSVLEKAHLELSEIDYFIFHQANKFMLTSIQNKLKIPSERFCINMQNYGNTVSSTIPMALAKSIHDGAVKLGDKVMLVGFGVGTSWAASLMTIEKELIDGTSSIFE